MMKALRLLSLFGKKEQRNALLRALEINCFDFSLPIVQRATKRALAIVTSALSEKSLPYTGRLPAHVIMQSVSCDTGLMVNSRSGECLIVLNKNDSLLLDYFYQNQSQKQFVFGSLRWIKRAIAERYISKETLSLFSLTIAYENIPPFLLSQTLFSGPLRQYSDILRAFFRGISKRDIESISLCFDYLHEFGHFLLESAPEALLDYEKTISENFERSTSAFPSFEDVHRFAVQSGWAENIDEMTAEFYDRVKREHRQASELRFRDRNFRQELTCDFFAVRTLMTLQPQLGISYWKLLKILHAKVSCHHIWVSLRNVCEQLDVLSILNSGAPLDERKLEIFSGTVSDRAHVASDFLLSFAMDSEDESLRREGAKSIDIMREFNRVSLETFLFPMLQIVPIFIRFALDKLADKRYRESMAYFARELSPEDLLSFVREPSFV